MECMESVKEMDADTKVYFTSAEKMFYIWMKRKEAKNKQKQERRRRRRKLLERRKTNN